MWLSESALWCFGLCFSEDSADLDSIEAVANEVLKMEMPSTPQQLQNLTEDIRERVETLSQVEVILQQSAADIARAELLLEEAKRARYLNIHTGDLGLMGRDATCCSQHTVRVFFN